MPPCNHRQLRPARLPAVTMGAGPPNTPRVVAKALTFALVAAAAALASPDSAGGPPAACADGKEKSADTAGHCCWAGQVWAGNKCVGAPTSCPRGTRLD